MPFNQKRAKAGRAGRMSCSRALGIAIMVLRNIKGFNIATLLPSTLGNTIATFTYKNRPQPIFFIGLCQLLKDDLITSRAIYYRVYQMTRNTRLYKPVRDLTLDR